MQLVADHWVKSTAALNETEVGEEEPRIKLLWLIFNAIPQSMLITIEAFIFTEFPAVQEIV